MTRALFAPLALVILGVAAVPSANESIRPSGPVSTPWGDVPPATLAPRDLSAPGAAAPFGPDEAHAAPPEPRDLPRTLPFGVGEKLEFSIDYGFINAGGATMEVVGLRKVSGQQCLDIRTEARSNGVFSKVYKVWDRAQTFVDPESLLPWRFEKKLREGGYHKDVLVKFDRRRDFALYEEGDSVSIHPQVQDELSAFYYVRAMDLEVGRDVSIDSHSNRKNYPVRVIVHGRETVEVPAGKFDCLVIEPVMAEEGIFTAKGKLTIWVTDDERRMPVLMKTKVLVGSIGASLKRYELGEPYVRAQQGDPSVTGG
ncbi:MAG: DUF3108 domain-containing protein [bacterium]